MKRSVIKKAAWTVVGLAVAAQAVRPERENPPVSREVQWESEATRQLATAACYDCHSNRTDWPWYSNLAPASWMIARDVAEGRDHLNFTAWDEPNHGGDEIVEVVESGEMPPGTYLLMHPEARLAESDRDALLRGIRATMAADPPVPEEGDHDEAS